MKKALLIVALAAIAFASCTKENVAPTGTTASGLVSKDGRNHDINDDNLPKHSGKDDAANHNANDDKLPKHSGKDDGLNHK
jgi:hypothetical protein